MVLMLIQREFYCDENFQKNNSKWTKGRYYRLGYIRDDMYYLLDDTFCHYEPLTKKEIYDYFSDIY